MNKVHKCFSCRNGEVDQEADCFVVLTAEGCAPIRGYLCNEHLDMLTDDGYKIAKYRPVSAQAVWKEYELHRDNMRAARNVDHAVWNREQAIALKWHSLWCKLVPTE